MIREQRCCMCPNINEPSAACPGITGTVHPKNTTCDFVRVYFDGKGQVIFVSKGLGERYMVFRQKEGGMGMHRLVSKRLPERRTFDEAQEDLNQYALAKKWQHGGE
jgi:hypothetical protein